jgi:hypothetical protein
MAFDKQTLIVIGASTAIGFLGDCMIYSLAASKGGKFKLAVPKGMEAFKLLALGVATGFVVDFAIKKISYAIMQEQERDLIAVAEKEREKIRTGEVAGLKPLSVNWGKVAGA